MKGLDKSLNRISGHSNPKLQQFEQIATALFTGNFYAFVPVGADAVISVLKDAKGASALGQLDGTAIYQNVYYPGSFTQIKLASGKAIVYLDEQ